MTTVYVMVGARECIQREIAEAGVLETGGLLLGWARPDLDSIVVDRATGPGRRARRSATRLRLDARDLQKLVDEVHKHSEGRVTYLGDWHLHPGAATRPSKTDRSSLLNIVEQVGIEAALLIVVGDRTREPWEWCCFVGSDSRPADLVIVMHDQEMAP